MSGHVWHPTPELLRNSNVAVFSRAHGIPGYRDLHRRSVEDPAWFWAEAADDIGIVWHRPPDQILDDSAGLSAARWFTGGRTNLVDSCLLRHIHLGRGAATALRCEHEDGSQESFTYSELDEASARVAAGLRRLGAGAGDRVGAFLPLGAEAVTLLFACARIGAVLVPLFSGFGSDAVALRLRDCDARILVTAQSVQRRGKPHDMLSIARAALAGVPSIQHLVVTGTGSGGASVPAREHHHVQTVTPWAHLREAEPAEVVSLPSDAPFLLIYTSGTTGRPKGAIHTHGGFPLQVGSEVRYNLDARPGDVAFWVTDTGWVMFPLTAIGFTLAGAALLTYDGAIDHPHNDRLWRLLDDHAVTIFGSSPSLSRTIMARGPRPCDHADLTRLRILGSTGEPWSADAWLWCFQAVGGERCPIINISGGTEVGGSLLASSPVLPQSRGSLSGPCLGIDALIVDEAGVQVPDGTLGELAVRRPWPGMTRGLWRAPERFQDAYFSRWPGLWAHGDLASVSGAEWFLHGRSDDVINIAGKRLGPAEVEEAAAAHPAVAEVAAVGVPDAIKGEAVWCLVVPSNGALARGEAAQIRDRVADALGRSFAPSRVLEVPELPKTRNNKVMRRLIRDLIRGDLGGDTSSLSDPRSLDGIRKAVEGSTRRIPEQPSEPAGDAENRSPQP